MVVTVMVVMAVSVKCISVCSLCSKNTDYNIKWDFLLGHGGYGGKQKLVLYNSGLW